MKFPIGAGDHSVQRKLVLFIFGFCPVISIKFKSLPQNRSRSSSQSSARMLYLFHTRDFVAWENRG